MKYATPEIFALENFEGPLEFLLHLIQQNEIDIYEVSLQKITKQYLSKQINKDKFDVDSGAEFIGLASLLLFLKSRMLLPKHEQPHDDNEDIDPRFEIIHQLIEYCRFKEAAKELSVREDYQSAFFGRGLDGPYEMKRNLGIEHLTLQDLAGLFKQIVARATLSTGQIQEEEWLVSDKIRYIRQSLNKLNELKFEDLFSVELCRDELIVTFLAVLELMKLGEIQVIKDSGIIWITKGVIDGQRN
jgi:segregation and condensation protein A